MKLWEDARVVRGMRAQLELRRRLRLHLARIARG